MSESERVCPECGKLTSSVTRHCRHCGHDFYDVPKLVPAQKFSAADFGRWLTAGLGMLLVVVFVAIAFRVASSATPPHSSGDSGVDQAAQPVGYISRSDYGEAWPLTCDHAVVSCPIGSCVTITVDGVTYAVNGTARNQETMAANGWQDFNSSGLWAADPSGMAPKKSIGPIIDKGLAMCGAR